MIIMTTRIKIRCTINIIMPNIKPPIIIVCLFIMHLIIMHLIIAPQIRHHKKHAHYAGTIIIKCLIIISKLKKAH